MGASVAAKKKLELDPDLPIRAGLERALAQVLAYAADCAAAAEREPEQSVHEFRKSVRRARAVLKLMRDHLPETLFEQLAQELRAAVRGTSFLRDADMLLEQILVVVRESSALESPAALLDHLRAQRERTHDVVRIAQVLREGAAPLETLAERFGQALPEGLDWADVTRAVRRSHKRAREAWRRADRTREDDSLHSWRKRVKELRYQLELLKPCVGDVAEHARLASVAEELGECTDRMVLRAYLRIHSDDIAAGTGALERYLDRAISIRIEDAVSGAQDLFGVKSKAFAKRTVTLAG